MKTAQRTVLLITIAIIVSLVFMGTAIQTGATVHINLSFQQWLTQLFVGEQNNEASQFALVELPQNSDARPELLVRIEKLDPHRVFWVLPDAPLSDEQQELIKQFQLLTVKVPSYDFNAQGQLLQQNYSAWQPKAGYLTEIDQYWGLARTIPFSTSYSPVLNAPAKALISQDPTSEAQRNWSVPHYIDYSQLNINSPILNRNLTRGVIPESLVKDKDIWLMQDFDLTHSRIKIAGSPGDLNWHPVQYHALAILALEQQTFWLELPLHFKVLILATLILSFLLATLAASSRYKRIFGVCSLLVVVVAIASICLITGFVIPLLEFLMASIMLLLVAETNFVYRRNEVLKRVDGIIDREISPIAKRHENLQKDFWVNAANLISQNLNLQRTIFFQLPENAVHLEEIASINCELSDIFEMRRDINREPYAQALQSKQAVDASRTYFKNKEDDEFEILSPFYKGASILGFWALTTKESDASKRNQLKEQVNLLSTQISLLLDLQQQNHSGQKRYNLATNLYGTQEQQKLHHINSKLNTLVSESNSYLALFSSMSTPAVLFDVFGQLNMVNKSLQHITNKIGISLNNTSAFELLSQLLPLNKDSLRNIIRQLTLEQNIEQQRFFVTLQEEEFVAVLSSVKRDEESVFGQHAHLHISGLLCEFHSLKEIQNYLEIERGLYDNYLMKIKNHLSTLQMGLIQIERKAENPLLNQLSAYLNVELKKASDITRRTHYFMNKVTGRKESNALPFQPIAMLQKCLDRIHKSAQESPLWRGVNFDSDIPTFPVLGLGSPELFEKIINTALRLLADDAITPKTIKVLAKQMQIDGNDILYFKLESEGYGLPNDQLQQMYEQNLVLGENTILSELLMALQNAKHAKMDCRLKSKVGKGYRLSILIEGISLHD